MLHYYAKDFFSPVIIASKVTQANQLLIYVVSDLLNNLTNLNIDINIYEWKSSRIIHTNQINNVTVVSCTDNCIRNFCMPILSNL
jgi:hypothetical protein